MVRLWSIFGVDQDRRPPAKSTCTITRFPPQPWYVNLPGLWPGKLISRLGFRQGGFFTKNSISLGTYLEFVNFLFILTQPIVVR